MRLFQHLTQCSTAIQMFLNCMNNYQCLLPLTSTDANIDDIQWTKTERLLARDVTSMNTRSDDQTYSILKNLPIPPGGYRFSLRQQQEQWLFFKEYHDQLPVSLCLDIFDMNIIALRT
jgi:hypothetical protein